jgi:hypothetical protein
MERFNLKKLSGVEGKEWYRVEISNRFAALENLGTEGILIKLGKLFGRNFDILSNSFPSFFNIPLSVQVF